MQFLHLFHEVYPPCDDYTKNRISYPYSVRIADVEERIAFEEMLERDGFECAVHENGYPVLYVNFTLKRFGNAVKAAASGCIGPLYEKDDFMENVYTPYMTSPSARAILTNNYAQSAALSLSGSLKRLVVNRNVSVQSYFDYEKRTIESDRLQVRECDVTLLEADQKFEIELKEGTDPSSYFFFNPVRYKGNDTSLIEDDNFSYSDDVFCIEESDIECFLWHFFKKYFDSELIYNKNRVEVLQDGYANAFEWYLTNNYFTYETVEVMCRDILNTVDMLTHDYYNPELDEVKKEYCLLYMTNHDDEDHMAKAPDAVVKKHIYVVLDFYLRFVNRIRKMMDISPESNMIAISGP